MKTLFLFPPNYRAINKAFSVRGKPVIFCYGDTIYNPTRITVTPSLVAHEGVHSRQQGEDPRGWFARSFCEAGSMKRPPTSPRRGRSCSMSRGARSSTTSFI